jgi:hypothetical protein
MRRNSKLLFAAIIYIVIGCLGYLLIHSGNPAVNNMPIELFTFIFVIGGTNCILDLFHSTSVFDDNP